jgi:hypothetical protein
MSALQPIELDEFNEPAELEAAVDVVKDSKAKQKYEARRRIDEIMEQKRLRELLDDWELTDD